MPTLLLRLCGPMQSWGTRSRFTERDTELEPSKSGVIGLLCAALGLPRWEPVDSGQYDLAGLRMGVRVDREGRMANDYHTAGGGRTGIIQADGQPAKFGVLSNRYYLADADFLVGLEGSNRSLLERLDAALRAPRWQLFLGRKSFVLAAPVYLPSGGIREGGLEDVLKSEESPSIRTQRQTGEPGDRRRYVLERAPGETSEVRMDQPLGTAFQQRTFGPRWIETRFSA